MLANYIGLAQKLKPASGNKSAFPASVIRFSSTSKVVPSALDSAYNNNFFCLTKICPSTYVHALPALQCLGNKSALPATVIKLHFSSCPICELHLIASATSMICFCSTSSCSFLSKVEQQLQVAIDIVARVGSMLLHLLAPSPGFAQSRLLISTQSLVGRCCQCLPLCKLLCKV